MAVQYSVNLRVSAGVDFYHEFHLTNADRTPMNITGCKFTANIAKHTRSIIATTSTSIRPVFNYIPLKTKVVDGRGGVFAISLSEQGTSMLKEGKMVYDVVMHDQRGASSNVVNGLVFVDIAMVTDDNLGFDGGTAPDPGQGVELDGGGAFEHCHRP